MFNLRLCYTNYNKCLTDYDSFIISKLFIINYFNNY